MMKPKLSPREIVERLQIVEALTAEGLPVADALRQAGMGEAEYERWRVEYNGLGRTLGPLLRAPAKPKRRKGPVHPPKPPPCG